MKGFLFATLVFLAVANAARQAHVATELARDVTPIVSVNY